MLYGQHCFHKSKGYEKTRVYGTRLDAEARGRRLSSNHLRSDLLSHSIPPLNLHTPLITPTSTSTPPTIDGLSFLFLKNLIHRALPSSSAISDSFTIPPKLAYSPNSPTSLRAISPPATTPHNQRVRAPEFATHPQPPKQNTAVVRARELQQVCCNGVQGAQD